MRDLQPSDRIALAEMYEDFEPKRSAQGLPPNGETRVRIWLDRVLKTGRHLVVVAGGRVRGHIMLIPKEAESIELANFLHQSIRNRGIGTVLNRLALQIARAAGYRRVWLSVEPGNKAAIRSYEKAGFRRNTGSLWSPEIEMTADL